MDCDELVGVYLLSYGYTLGHGVLGQVGCFLDWDGVPEMVDEGVTGILLLPRLLRSRWGSILDGLEIGYEGLEK
jgi:hypothetical protein